MTTISHVDIIATIANSRLFRQIDVLLQPPAIGLTGLASFLFSGEAASCLTNMNFRARKLPGPRHILSFRCGVGWVVFLGSVNCGRVAAHYKSRPGAQKNG